MIDKNGKEIKSGMVVRVSGAFFKKDNGLYFVDRSPGDASWLGREYHLTKISKSGKICKGGTFWPLRAFVSDPKKRRDAKRWNDANAEIEITSINDMTAVKGYFEAEAERLENASRMSAMRWGENHPVAVEDMEISRFFAGVAATI